MSIIGSGNALLLASAAPAAAFTVERSLRFNGNADSSYLNRTPSSASNRTTWTWSGWVKRSNVAASGYQSLFTTTTAGYETLLYFDTSNRLRFYNYSGSTLADKVTTAVFRDPSAWYHIVLTWDTTNATAADRVRIYVNGVRQTAFDTSTDAGSSEQSTINNTIAHMLGSYGAYANNFFDGYLADINFVDGQALTPGDFAETDATTGQWVPKAYSGTYGTNGFRLDFSDDSSVAALGYDAAGSNDWTPNNFTVSGPTTTGFKVVTYTGNGTSQSISGLGISPDLVWIKSRSAAYSNALFDTIRGAQIGLQSNATNTETTDSDSLTSFDSDGFSVGSGNTIFGVNTSGQTFVGWCWDAGSSTVSNTDGSVTSSVRANQDTGFSVVSFTPASSGAFTIGHGLNATPSLVIAKARNRTTSWFVYSDSLSSPLGKFLDLSSTAGVDSNYSNFWGTTAFSSTVFGMNTGVSCLSTDNMIAYCFAPKPGISAIGSYTGNGSTSGPSVTTGFKPSFILMKRTDASGYNWVIFDAARNNFDERIYPNSNSAGATGITAYSVNSTGFTVVTSDTVWNASGGTYIYMAFAEPVDPSEIDSLFDSASTGTQSDSGLGGEVSGNYCTWNPLQNNGTLVNGNLDFSHLSASYRAVYGTVGISSGKWYFEVTVGSSGAQDIGVGIAKASGVNTTSYVGSNADSWGYYSQSGFTYNNASGSSYGATYTTGDVIGIALDVDAGTLVFYKNGSSQGTAFSGLTAGTYFPAVSCYNSSLVANFGQRAFAYTAPSGYKALCLTNTTDPTITDPSDYMDVALYTGNSGTQSISGYNVSPDFLWIKRRNAAEPHVLHDAVRGASNGLSSDSTGAEFTSEPLSSFDSGGFSFSGGSAASNNSGGTYVGWMWDAGTFTASNTDGSITSSVRANASAGFSIVTYTGTGSAATVGHGLNDAPQMIIVKSRNNVTDWCVYHANVGNTAFLKLNTTSASQSFNAWNSTSPTSSVFSIGNIGETNTNTYTYVAYCFAPVAGFSAFGSYTGSSDLPFVWTGFKSRFILIKSTSIVGQWGIWDTARNSFNVTNSRIIANLSNAELTHPAVAIDVLSNGFKLRNTDSDSNQSSASYIWAAFAESPFKFANAR